MDTFRRLDGFIKIFQSSSVKTLTVRPAPSQSVGTPRTVQRYKSNCPQQGASLGAGLLFSCQLMWADWRLIPTARPMSAQNNPEAVAAATVLREATPGVRKPPLYRGISRVTPNARLARASPGYETEKTIPMAARNAPMIMYMNPMPFMVGTSAKVKPSGLIPWLSL